MLESASRGGESAWSGGSLPDPGGVSALSRGGVCLVRGGRLPGPGGGLPDRGYDIPACTEADTPRGQTDTCKNITLATTSLRPVINVNGASNFEASFV